MSAVATVSVTPPKVTYTRISDLYSSRATSYFKNLLDAISWIPWLEHQIKLTAAGEDIMVESSSRVGSGSSTSPREREMFNMKPLDAARDIRKHLVPLAYHVEANAPQNAFYGNDPYTPLGHTSEMSLSQIAMWITKHSDEHLYGYNDDSLVTAMVKAIRTIDRGDEIVESSSDPSLKTVDQIPQRILDANQSPARIVRGLRFFDMPTLTVNRITAWISNERLPIADFEFGTKMNGDPKVTSLYHVGTVVALWKEGEDRRIRKEALQKQAALN
jgi:hypothetical protein